MTYFKGGLGFVTERDMGRGSKSPKFSVPYFMDTKTFLKPESA